MKIYDDIFRTLCEKNPKLLIYIINEVFHTKYKPEDKIELLSGEHHYADKETKDIEEIITDSSIKIQNKIYHIECQSKPDGSIVLRMIEYDFHIALEQAVRLEDRYRIDFPQSAVLYLRHNKNTADKVTVEIRLPNEQIVEYSVPIIKVKDYTDEDIIEKQLYFLVPYYIMKYEHLKKEDMSEKILDNINKEYKKLLDGMVNACDTGKIDSYDISNIMDLTNRLVDYIFAENKEVKEGVNKIMSGQVLETYADKRWKQGIEEGMVQGIEQGIEQGKIESIINLMETLDLTAKQAMDAIKIPISQRSLYLIRMGEKD